LISQFDGGRVEIGARRGATAALSRCKMGILSKEWTDKIKKGEKV
jgi:hypothetical protein